MIRHAAAAAFPVVPLPVAVIEPPLLALLVPPVGVPPLLPLVFFAGIAPRQYRWPRSQWQQIQNTAPQPIPTANPAAQELLVGPHPRPCGRTGTTAARQGNPWSHLQMTLGRFFRVGAKNPDRLLTAGVFAFRLRPHPASASASLTGGEDSTSRYRRPSQKNAALKFVIPCPLFPLCGAERSRSSV